jgi:hypothetical protein
MKPSVALCTCHDLPKSEEKRYSKEVRPFTT